MNGYLDELLTLIHKLQKSDELDLTLLVRASCCLLDFETPLMLSNQPSRRATQSMSLSH